MTTDTATDTTTTTNSKGAKTVAKKPSRPTMAARKSFELPPIQTVDEVPAVVRTGNPGARMPLGLDELLEATKKSKKPAMRFIPVEFWEAWGIEEKNIEPAKNKDRLRRAFYSWQGDDEEKAKYTLAFSDQVDKKQNYTGVNMYLTLKP